jgi:hypothetical protein
MHLFPKYFPSSCSNRCIVREITLIPSLILSVPANAESTNDVHVLMRLERSTNVRGYYSKLVLSYNFGHNLNNCLHDARHIDVIL